MFAHLLIPEAGRCRAIMREWPGKEQERAADASGLMDAPPFELIAFPAGDFPLANSGRH